MAGQQCIKTVIDITPGPQPPYIERCPRTTTHPSGRCYEHQRWEDIRQEYQGPLCADGSPVHDFKGQTSCPACGFTGIHV